MYPEPSTGVAAFARGVGSARALAGSMAGLALGAVECLRVCTADGMVAATAAGGLCATAETNLSWRISRARVVFPCAACQSEIGAGSDISTTPRWMPITMAWTTIRWPDARQSIC